MEAVPRKAVGRMLRGKEKGVRGFWGQLRDISGGNRICVTAGGGRQGLWGCLLPGVDGDAHLQEGSQIDACKDRTRCHHQSHSGGLHPAPLQDLGSHGMWGLVPVPTYP